MEGVSHDETLPLQLVSLCPISDIMSFRVCGLHQMNQCRRPGATTPATATNPGLNRADASSVRRLQPAAYPSRFATLLRTHIGQRPNLRTGAGPDCPWLFPSTLAGRHLHPNTVMDRLRELGVNLLGARNRAIGELVLECPPSLVADGLGYSPKVAFLHADKAAEPWARYVGRSIRKPLRPSPGLDVVPIRVADECGVGPVLRPVSRLVPGGPTGRDGCLVEGIDRARIPSAARAIV